MIPITTPIIGATGWGEQLNGLLATVAQATIPQVADLNYLKALGVQPSGSPAIVVEGGALFVSNGATFVQATPARFPSAATRDAAYAKASGAYRVSTAHVTRTDKGWTEGWNGSGWSVRGGLVPIRPTAVSGSGATINADGSVSFTAMSTGPVIQGLFSADFDSYYAEYYLAGSANTTTLGVRLATGTTVRQDGTYYYAGVAQSGSAAVGTWAGAPNSFFDIARVGNASTEYASGNWTFHNPFDATKRTHLDWAGRWSDGTVNGYIAAGGGNTSLESHDGINIITSQGTLTGRVKFYGHGRG